MIIAGNDLSKSYRSVKVLNKVNISCSAGEICGLLGSNGAGKTTLFKILCGLVSPDNGTIEINSKGPKPIGAIIEKPALYDYLNAYQNLKIFGKIQGAQIDDNSLVECLVKVGLPLDRKDPVGNFSMGMKQRLGIAIALLNDPACLVLDEPFSGLDPLGIASLRKLILDLAEKEKMAILLSSHIIDELSKVSTTLYVISNGKIVESGPTQRIINENTDTYTFCASNISSSKVLGKYTTVIKGNCASVQITQEKVPELIQELFNEEIYITSCTPELNMEKLFELSAK
ncbi:MAG: ABC transporter ATP-binding protein [Bacteroidetes bacterium]|nr:MAG: ABC transporter ATP-binding protein [Bacteroidota bacterium]